MTITSQRQVIQIYCILDNNNNNNNKLIQNKEKYKMRIIEGILFFIGAEWACKKFFNFSLVEEVKKAIAKFKETK